MPDLPTLNRLDNRLGMAQHRIMGKTNSDLFFNIIFREPAKLKGLGDYGRKIFLPSLSANMGHIRPTHGVGREDPVFIRHRRLLNTVGGHQNSGGNAIEFTLLVLPGRTVMPGQMRVLL